MHIHTHPIYKSFLIIFILAALLTGCSSKSDSPKNQTFDEYTEQLFKDEICANTINLHYTLAYPENFGIQDYTPSLGSFSTDNMDQFKDDLLAMKEELYQFQYNDLTADQQLTYDIIIDYLDTEISAADLYLYSEVLSPTVGYQAQLPILLAEYTFRTERDIQDYLALTAQIEELFSSLLAYEQEKSAAGLFMADFAVDDVVSQMEDFISSPTENYMIDVFNNKIEEFPGLSQEQKQQYKDQNQEIIISSVIPAYQKLIDGLLSLKGTGRNPGGLCYFPQGDAYYKYLVRSETGSAKTIPQLKQRTESFIQDSLKEMALLFTKNPSVLDAFDNYSFALTDPDAILKDLMGKIGTDFPEAPKVSYTIKYVHPSMEEKSSPAFYLTPPIDDVQNNIIYINNKSVSDDIYTTLAHEGYPGHLYQTVYTNSKNLPLVRHLFGSSGYTEGWATYVEYYSYGISGIDQDLAKLLTLNNAASLGLYAYVDLSVNYDGWDEEDVASYLSRYGYDNEEIAGEIFRAMVEEPANYLSYFIGYLEFLELREKAEKISGDAFSLKNFHDVVLTLGPAPFDILSKHMTDRLAH